MSFKRFSHEPYDQSAREKRRRVQKDISQKLIVKEDDQAFTQYYSKQFSQTPKKQQKRNITIEGILEIQQQSNNRSKNDSRPKHSISQKKKNQEKNNICNFSKNYSTVVNQKWQKNKDRADLQNLDPDPYKKNFNKSQWEKNLIISQFEEVGLSKNNSKKYQSYDIKELILQIMKKNIIPFIMDKLQEIETKLERKISKCEKNIFILSQQQKNQHLQLKQGLQLLTEAKKIPKISSQLCQNSKNIKSIQIQINEIKQQLQNKFQKLQDNDLIKYTEFQKLKNLIISNKLDQKPTQRKHGEFTDKKQQSIQKIERMIRVYNENFVQIQKRLSKIEEYSKKFQQQLSLNSLEISSCNQSSI